MTFEELFARLRKQGLTCGAAEMHFENMTDRIGVSDNFEFLSGYLWGLDTARLITEYERKELGQILMDIRFKE